MLPSPSSVSLSLDTFSLPGEGIYGRAFSAYLAVFANFRSQPRLLSASNYVPQGSGQRSWTQGLAKPDKRGKAGSERRKACFHPGGSGFHLPCGVARATPCFHPIDFHVTRSLLCFFPCTPRATALRQARVSGGNLQNCAPSAACGGAMAPRKNRPFLRSLPPPVPLVLYAMLTLSLPPPST